MGGECGPVNITKAIKDGVKELMSFLEAGDADHLLSWQIYYKIINECGDVVEDEVTDCKYSSYGNIKEFTRDLLQDTIVDLDDVPDDFYDDVPQEVKFAWRRLARA